MIFLDSGTRLKSVKHLHIIQTRTKIRLFARDWSFPSNLSSHWSIFSQILFSYVADWMRVDQAGYDSQTGELEQNVLQILIGCLISIFFVHWLKLRFKYFKFWQWQLWWVLLLPTSLEWGKVYAIGGALRQCTLHTFSHISQTIMLKENMFLTYTKQNIVNRGWLICIFVQFLLHKLCSVGNRVEINQYYQSIMAA